VPEWIQVVPEDLHMSAATVDAHADEMHVRHATANGRIEAAQLGLPAGAAAALNSAVTKWQAATATLFGRLVDHSTGLRVGAASYQQTDEHSAGEITATGDTVTGLDLGV
jgi:uncharacterized protein YukE